MREIKFRAWDIEKNKMIFDVTPDPSKFSLFWGDCGMSGDHWEADEEKYSELMQFTGLKDKNGEEIYEGDLVRTDGRVVPVEFKAASWVLDSGDGDYWPSLHVKHDQCEVIGNIYETPELLKTK